MSANPSAFNWLRHHALRCDGVIAIRSGRRWKTFQEAALFIEDEQRRLRVLVPIIPPIPAPPDIDFEGLFWKRPEVDVCVAALRLTRQYGFYRVTDALPLIHLMDDGSVDPEKLLRAVGKAMGSGNRVPKYLYEMSYYIRTRNPSGAKAIGRLHRTISVIFPDGRYPYYYIAYDTLRELMRTSGYLERLEASDPEAAERVEYLIGIIPQGSSLEGTILLFERLAREEINERCRQLPANKIIRQRSIDTIPF